MRHAGLNSWLKPKSCRIPRHFEMWKNFWIIPAGTGVISVMTFRFWVTDKLIVKTNVRFHGSSEFKGRFNKWPIFIDKKGKHCHFAKMAKLPTGNLVWNWRPYRYHHCGQFLTFNQYAVVTIGALGKIDTSKVMTSFYHSRSGTVPGNRARDAPKVRPMWGAWCSHVTGVSGVPTSPP